MEGQPLNNKDRLAIAVLIVFCLCVNIWLYKIGVLAFLLKVFATFIVVGLIYDKVTNNSINKKDSTK